MNIDLTINGEARQVASGQTLAQLLDELNVNRQQVAVEVNAELVPRESHADRELAAGDQIEIVTLVGGG